MQDVSKAGKESFNSESGDYTMSLLIGDFAVEQPLQTDHLDAYKPKLEIKVCIQLRGVKCGVVGVVWWVVVWCGEWWVCGVWCSVVWCSRVCGVVWCVVA